MLIIVKNIIHKLLGEKGQDFIVKLLIKFKLNRQESCEKYCESELLP